MKTANNTHSGNTCRPVTGKCPAIIIAATGSGTGKTSITIGLVSWLRQRGYKVQTFKVGPDFLDPTYLARASGRPCYNLDGWMCGMNYAARLFAEKSGDADIAVIEGAMGLFDSAGPETEEGSTAEIAARLGIPVLLVVNAHGASRSIAATVKGFAEFDRKVHIAGVILNHAGSTRHAAMIRKALSASGLPPLAGAIPRNAFPSLPSRHLGLVTANTDNLSPKNLTKLTAACRQHLDLNMILKLARPAGIALPKPADSPAVQRVLRVGIAWDDAFHFYYPDNLAALEKAGCKLVKFSPLKDHCLPADLSALYFGGGYPEEFAGTLSKNVRMRQAIKDFAATGGSIYAECGGLMYLSRSIRINGGASFPMVGLLPCGTHMLPKRRMLGYVQIRISRDCLLGRRGMGVRGHEFHYSDMTGKPAGSGGWKTAYGLSYCGRGNGKKVEGYSRDNILISYVHAHFASNPACVNHLVSKWRKTP